MVKNPALFEAYKLKQVATCLKKSSRIGAQKWNGFRIFLRQVLWNGNIDAETHYQDFCRWKPILALKTNLYETGPWSPGVKRNI